MFKHAALNRIYRLVWSHARQALVAVAETAKGRGKQGTRRKLLLALALTPPLALGAPSGGEVIAGSGRITQQGSTTRIQQDSAKLSLNWQGFNVGAQESVVFAQPDASSVAVNRIYDANGSQILGHLSANGQVFLINPNGVLFGRGATVDVGGLVASTLDLQGTDSKGTHFAGNGQGRVVNDGTITAATGGYVALLGNKVTNTGTVTAQLGTVAMGAGSAVTLKFEGSTLAQLQVDQSVLKSTVENGGLVQANGGQVLMSAGAADSLLASVVNNTGVVEAQTVQQQGGKIVLLSGMSAGTTTVAGKLDASAPTGGNGGFIETSGAHVKVADGARITTAAPSGVAGTWLIDPHDFTVSATANGTVDNTGTPSGDISGATLSTALNTGNVAILSAQGSNASGSGDINVNDVVSWSANTLTLTAARDINVNAVMTASGSSSLELNTATTNGMDTAVAGGTVKMGLNAAGFTGRVDFGSRSGTGFLRINAHDYTVINALGDAGSTTTTDLQGMAGNLGGYYALGSNIDASATASWNAGAGFAPMGDPMISFNGSFDGMGHTVNGLTINQPGAYHVGLFGSAGSTAALRNVGLVGGSVMGGTDVGSLVGTNAGTLTNVYATGSVSGTGVMSGNVVGGLVGNNTGTLSNTYATGTVSGSNNIGGLVGGNEGILLGNNYATGTVMGDFSVGGLIGFNSGNFANAYATGTVSSAGDRAGGLVGTNFNGTITHSYATGGVSAGSGYPNVSNAGGLVGLNYGGTVTTSYATGAVRGAANNVGGLVGNNKGTLTSGSASGEVHGTGDYVGGLVGYNDFGTMTDASASGGVSGNRYVGGLVGGNNAGTIANSTASGDVSGADYVGGLAGFNCFGAVCASTLTASYATGAVSGNGSLGGLVGYNFGILNTSYATGAVNGTAYFVGGLVGDNRGSVTNTYATGPVTGGVDVGGLVGGNHGTLTTSYATGLVRGSGLSVGGLVGNNDLGTVTSSDWNTATTGRSTSSGGTGLTSAQMMSLTSFADWNTVSPNTISASGGSGAIWRIYEGHTAPLLTAFLTALDLSQTVTYDGTTQQLQVPVGVVTASVASGTTAGSYPGDYYSTQQGYDITGLTLTIAKRALTSPSIANATSVYGDAVVPGAVSWGNLVPGDGVSAAVSLVSPAFSSSGNLKAGSYRQTASATLTGADSDNYSFAGYTTPLARYTVSPLSLTGSITAGSSVYGSTLAPGAATFTNAFANDVLSTPAVSVNITGRTSTSGNLRAGSYTGIQSVSALSGADAANYSFADVSGNYVVSKRALTGSIAAGASVYGSPLAPGLATLTNGLANDLLGTATVAVNTNGRASTSGNLKVGSFSDIESIGALSGPDGANYSSEGLAGDYTVTPLALTASGIAAVNSVYGAAPAVGAVSWLNLLNDDRVNSAVSIVLRTFSTSGNLRVGSYRQAASASLSGADAGNYSFAGYTTPSANYAVSKLVLTGSIAKGTSIYGNALGLGTVNFTNAIPRDVLGTATRALATAGRTSTSGKLKAGSYTASQSISALSGPDAANYDFSQVKGDYTVTKRPLTGSITQGKSKFKAVLKPGVATFTNKITNDVLGTIVVGVNTTSKLKGGFLPAGTYLGLEFIKSLSGADAVNYTFANVKGNYKVTP